MTDLNNKIEGLQQVREKAGGFYGLFIFFFKQKKIMQIN